MSLQCPQSPVYRTSVQQKLQSQQAAKLFRLGKFKLRDLLREQCRKRVREARQANYGQNRTINVDSLLRKELVVLDHDINLQEEIYKELHAELNEWLAVQMEEEETYLIDIADDNQLICPVCQKAALVSMEMQETFACKCGVNFLFAADMNQLRLTLQSQIEAHEKKCHHRLLFFVEPQTTEEAGTAAATDAVGNCLNAMCEACDYFCTL